MEQNRVAIVEDESIVALDISAQLRSSGYDVVGIYPSGEQALTGLADAPADIVLLDIRLRGELDGVETAQLVKARFGLPVILLTAYGDEATLQRAKLAQPFAFILKPVDARELRSAIVISLYRHSMEEAVRELREREDQLRRAQKLEAIGRLTGGIAHDFNNLLTVILGYTRLLRDEVGSLAQASTIDASERAALLEDIDGIQKAALRSASLTRQLLAFSRHQKMERRAVSINDVVADMQKMLLRLVGDDVSLRVDLIADPSVVYADPSQIEQVLMNLVVNARDAMPDGGAISIRTESQTIDPDDPRRPAGVVDRGFVMLMVRDRGCGMTADVAERIFEPFYTTKSPGEGTGLGLSTVYGIVTQSGGFIDVDTEPGRGTAFLVYLPTYTGRPLASMDEPTGEAPGDGTETVLIVEDEEPLRELLERVLSRRGYTVIGASNPGEALLFMESRSEPIDVVISDIAMPLMNGVRLVERLRAGGFDGRALYISAYPEGQLTDREIDELGDSIIRKPVDPETLVAHLRRILDS